MEVENVVKIEPGLDPELKIEDIPTTDSKIVNETPAETIPCKVEPQDDGNEVIKSLEDVNDESNPANENQDDDDLRGEEYAYLDRPEFSSEQFKIEIMNLPKYYGAGVS